MAISSSSTSTMVMACFFLLLISSGLGLSSASVLTVGDAMGWTTIGKIDYGAWASKNTFHVGDTLLFKYNNTYHNVMEVKKADYDGCIATSPIMEYKTGNDSVLIKSEGDHYFLCGVPGHCAIGQKLKISALAEGSSAAPSTPPAGGSPAVPAPTSGPPPAPKASSAAVAYKGLWFSVFAGAVAAGFMIMSS